MTPAAGGYGVVERRPRLLHLDAHQVSAEQRSARPPYPARTGKYGEPQFGDPPSADTLSFHLELIQHNRYTACFPRFDTRRYHRRPFHIRKQNKSRSYFPEILTRMTPHRCYGLIKRLYSCKTLEDICSFIKAENTKIS